MDRSTLPFRIREFGLPRWIGDYELPSLEPNARTQQLPEIEYRRKVQRTRRHPVIPPVEWRGQPVGETQEPSWTQVWSALQPLAHRNARIPFSSSVAPNERVKLRFRDAPMSVAYPMAEFYLAHGPRPLDLVGSVQQSQDILIEMLKDRFERVVDALLRYRLGTREDRQAHLDALFELYEEGLLTKGEVRRRGSIEPEDFYDEFRAYRLRIASH